MNTKPLRVLVAEDHDIVRESICEMLVAEGHEVCDAVDSGERAVEQTRQLQPDVVLMDIHMPGMGGIEAARLIRSLPKPVPVIFLTALADQEIAKQAAASGGFGYLVKPVQSRQITAMLQTAVERFHELESARSAAGPMARAREILDELSIDTRNSGLQEALAGFLAALGKEFAVDGVVICLLEAGHPSFPAHWGEVASPTSALWRVPPDVTPEDASRLLLHALANAPGVLAAPILAEPEVPIGLLVLFGAPGKQFASDDLCLLRLYGEGLGQHLANVRTQHPLTWRQWAEPHTRS